MTTVRCPSCGHTHNVPDADNERLAAALVEYTARTERTIAAQQEEIARLRAAAPAAPGPLDRLEAWLRANINDCAQFSFFPGQENEWECGVGEPFVRWEGGDAYPDLQGHFANAPTLAAAVDAALKKVQEAQP